MKGKAKKHSPGRGRPRKERPDHFKRLGNYRSKYNERQMREAVAQVQSKRMTYKEVEQAYGIPKSTLSNRINQVYGEKLGRPTVLTEEEENIIAQRLKIMAAWGFPLTRPSLQNLVKDYLDRLGRTTRHLKAFVRDMLKYF